MKKAIAILLTALLMLTVFVSCEGDVEDLFGDNITITFNGNGSTSGQMAALKVARGKEVKLTANAYEKTDSEFTGWNTKADGSGDDYEDEEFVYFEEDTTLYAQWSSGVTITFDSNGATGSMDPQVVPKGIPTKLNAIGTHITKEDEEFIGWNTKADGTGVLYKDEATVTLSEDLTLYAQWSSGVTITFDGNDGSGSMEPVKIFAGLYKLPENGFTAPEGYVFVRWSETADGEVEYEVGYELEVTKDVTLYAIWAQVLSTTPGDWLNGRYIITANTDINNRFGASGTLKLYLLDGKTLNANKGISVTDGNTLVINKVGTKGNGNLIANGDGEKSGIGSGTNQAGGTVTINGGTVTANGGENAAGIGGGYGGDGGTVTINGGTVNAQGGVYAAGIGGGVNGAGKTVTINGGIVTATGGQYGAGIGGGNSGAGGTTISISGGSVTANGGSQAAGIGGGRSGAGGTVTIKGGTVTANGGINADGIGKGDSGSDSGTLTIGTGVTMLVSNDASSWATYDGETRRIYMTTPIILTATSTSWTNGKVYTLDDEDVTIASRITVTGKAALLLPAGRKLTASKGITVSTNNSLTIYGSGALDAILDPYDYDSNSKAAIGGDTSNKDCGFVTINGGTVTAKSSHFAAGIGGGEDGDGGKVTISGGIVFATGGNQSAGIGGGGSSSHGGDGGTVNISGGKVTATGQGGAAGIGGGGSNNDGGDGADVTISGGNVTATGGSTQGLGLGIGAGCGINEDVHDYGNNKKLTIGAGVHVYITGQSTAYANGPQDNVTTRYQNMTVNDFH